jgi:hypothetical protein
LPIGVPLSVLRLRKCETIMFSNFYNGRRSSALQAGRALNAADSRPWQTFAWLREDASVALRRGKLIRMAQQRSLAFLSRGVRRKPA